MAKENEVELSGFTLPANVRMPDASSGLMIGRQFSNGMHVSGVVERLVLNELTGVIRIHFAGQAQTALVYSTGMVAEEKLRAKKP